MIPRKKYEKNKITQLTKNRMIVRKGGYFPRRLFMAAVVFAMLVAFFLSLLILHTDIWFLLLYPTISVGMAIKYFYKNHVRFGEKISINKNRIIIELYGSTTKKVQFRKGTIKSMTCTISGIYYHFKVYKTDNSSLSFSIYDAKKQDPLSAVLKFTKLKKMIETNSANEKVIRYWSSSRNHKRPIREIKNVSDNIYEYRSDYFSITSKDNDLTIHTKGIGLNKLFIDNTSRLINFQLGVDESGSISFDDILSIEKVITETSPIDSSNRIKIKVIAHLKNGNSVDIINYATSESLPADMEIIEMDKDFGNLIAIIDMNIKASIDEDLNTLDLESLNQVKTKFKLKALDKLKGLNE